MRNSGQIVILTMIAATVALPMTGAVARATVVVPMDVQTLADHAGQVIVGTVAEVRSYWAADPRRIESAVSFTKVEYRKGALPDSTPSFTLIVPGGTVGQMTMRIGCAPEFVVGETWFLFVLPAYRTFPVVGLSEGAFRIKTDAEGIERVYRASGAAVVGVDDSLSILTVDAHSRTPPGTLVEATNVHLRQNSTAGEADTAVSYERFSATIQPILDASRQYHLTTPAGRRITVDYSPAPIRGLRNRPALRDAATGALAGAVRRDQSPRHGNRQAKQRVSKERGRPTP